MKKFLGNIFYIFGTVLGIFFLCNIIYYKCMNHSRLVAFEVYDALDVTNQNTDYTTLVLGDSVARQFFNPQYQSENKEVCYMATNQAITVAGNTVLLERFLENNPQLKEVYYVVRPDSLMSKANYTFTYSYFITPLFDETNMKYLDQETITGIEKNYGRVWTHNNFSKWILAQYPKCLEIYNNTYEDLCAMREKITGVNPLPDMTLPYLKKMEQICKGSQITLHLMASPVSEEYEYDFNLLQIGMRELDMTELYEELVSSIQYVKSDEFIDGVHLNKEYVLANRKRFIDGVLVGRRR